MKYTEEQLKAALVRALPDKLRIRKASQYGQTESCVWKENDYKVTQYEWPYIVSLVEDGLTDEQKITYLGAVAPKEDRKFYLCSILLAKWPARAQALADIGAITIAKATLQRVADSDAESDPSLLAGTWKLHGSLRKKIPPTT